MDDSHPRRDTDVAQPGRRRQRDQLRTLMEEAPGEKELIEVRPNKTAS
ncbi:MAG: hypothetical protein KDD51_08650 [Bdellovibrionales bacterium]|nr:hypothetical protein [Bdellovibrionales bacterium]